MAPPGGNVSLKHRVRRAHPLRRSANASVRTFDRAGSEAIRAEQEWRLRRLVRFAAARSPHYRNWFARSGVDPRSIRTLDDLGLLPFLTRQQLAETPDAFRTYPRRLLWPASSSGTSGTPVTALRTQGSSVFELAVLERQWGWFGLPPGPRRVILRGSALATDTPGAVTKLVPGGRHLLVSSFSLTPDFLPEIVAAVRAFRPHAVEGWPSSIALLAALLRDSGRRLPTAAVITSSEVVSAAQHELMREVYQGPIVDHYGQTERVAMAGTCEAGGYHVFPDYGIVELEPVPGATDRWEIIGTPLHNWGFPLFRYRTGDEVGPAPEGPCGCGRAFPRLDTVDGRREDVFSAADGRRIPVPSTLIDEITGLREAQIAQHAPGNFEIRLVPGVGFNRAETEATARHTMERIVGPGQTVTFTIMERVPRSSSGKLRAAIVVDDLVAPRETAVADDRARTQAGPR